MKRHIITLAVSCVMLNSCGIYTKYKPASEVSADLYGSEATAQTDTVSLGDMSWREVFTDPQLQTLIEHGLANNTDYRSAQLRVEEAEAALLSAKLAFLPAFAFAPQGAVSSFDSHKATQTYSIPITASWELDIFGKMRNAKKQAQALYAQSQDYRQAVRTQLIAGIANTYYSLLMLDAQLKISEQTASSWKETVNSTRALMNAGIVNETAVSQMEATYYSICTSILDLKEQINQVENSLVLLLADTPHTIQRGELALESAFYATNQARSAFYPSITLSGSAGWTNSAGAVITNPGKFLASAVGSLTQPLFARGQLLGQLKITKAQQEEARLSFEQALLNAGTEVNDALVQYHTARDKAVYFEKQIESLERAYKSTSLLMQHGTTTYLEVLTAQQGLLNAQLTQVANRFTEIQGVINLYQALGGGRE